MQDIKICGACIHNLKHIDITIPKQKLVVVTGISGSGKSSLAFDLIFEEGKNQYLRSLGILAGLETKKNFDAAEGVGPTIAVRQNTVRQNNPRSTVGSKTTLLNQLAMIYLSDGTYLNGDRDDRSIGSFMYTTTDGMCLQCNGLGSYYDVNLHRLIPKNETTLSQVYENLKVTAGFFRVLERRYGNYMEVPFWKLPDEIRESAVYGTYENGKQSYCIERILKTSFEKEEDVENVYSKMVCPECGGERVNKEASSVLLGGKRIGELGLMTLSQLQSFLERLPKETYSEFGQSILSNLQEKLKELIEFRLGHLTLYRELSSLSGGELQRVFLHQHIETQSDSLIYVFDEPMAGLHPSEKESMIEAVKQLRDLGNTVIVVEHDREMIQHADHVIEIGPKAGVNGGEVVFEGSVVKYFKSHTLLSEYFLRSNGKMISRKKRNVDLKKECLTVEHANLHYLKNLSVSFPLNCMVGVAGLSGSGKSSLVDDTLLSRLASAKKYGWSENLEGAELIDGFVKISQEPIGRNSNSTPASYVGIWDKIRELFANEAKEEFPWMTPGHFSFHSKGACQECKGSGYERIYLTSDFTVDKVCPSCDGKRFNEEALSVRYHGKSIAEVLELSITEAMTFFKDQNTIRTALEILYRIGMGYLKLGQPTSTLSGGEAQRVKLAKALSKPRRGNQLYVLDEPTTGLSLYDTDLLLQLLDEIVKQGNSVIVIEHNAEILRNCDYIIELGPEGGDRGGTIIAEGTPEQLMEQAESRTGRYLV